jgi:hypothetical protein
VSVVIHVVLGVVVWHAIEVPAVFERFLRPGQEESRAAERVRFVAVESAPAAGPAVAPARRPTRATPGAPAPVVTELVAPTTVPTELPPVPAQPVTEPTGGVVGGTGTAATGPLRGGTGPTRGVLPTYEDPRVWAGEPAFIYAPKTDKERIDSALVTTLGRYIDSLEANGYSPNKFERGDWTFGKEGSKWGIDQQYIRLGRFSIPTALLALLPLNRMQPNPILAAEQRNNAWMRADIMYHAQAAMNEEQFRQAVKAIRERKDRERRQASRVPPTNPGPVSSPGERPPPPR